MAKHKIIEAYDASGRRMGWTVVDLPDDYEDGDLHPAPQASDRHFETFEDAKAELHRRLDTNSK